MRSTVATNSSPCGICRYPIQEPTYVGQQVKCLYCGSINEAITQVTIPTPVFVGFVFFAVGALLGPSLWALTQGGSQYLARKATERFK